MAGKKSEKAQIDSQQTQNAQANFVAIEGAGENPENALAIVEESPENKLAAAIMAIRKHNAAMRINYFSIAIQLKAISDEKLFLAGGYKNIYDFADSEFGYKKSSVSNFVNIAEKFLTADIDGKINSIFAKGDIDFSYTQLQEFLRVPVSDIKNLVDAGTITPEMTTKQLREKVKALKADKPLSAAQAGVKAKANDGGKADNNSDNVGTENDAKEFSQLNNSETQSASVETENTATAQDTENDSKADVQSDTAEKWLINELEIENAGLKKQIAEMQKLIESLKTENSELKEKLAKYDYKPMLENI